MASAGVPERKEKAVAEGQARDAGGRRSQKSDAAFRTISEVAAELDVPQHVLRFWETKFSQIRPMKRGGGRRYYRPEDVILLTTLRDLLYREGYTIKGVQKLLRDNGAKALVTTVRERQEKAEGGMVGPVGLALSDDRESLEFEGGDDEPDSMLVEGADDDADAADFDGPAMADSTGGLDDPLRGDLIKVVDDLVALRALLRQALDATRPPPPPP
nr:MerR family transcriptional regulator [Rhodospira trueperi]